MEVFLPEPEIKWVSGAAFIQPCVRMDPNEVTITRYLTIEPEASFTKNKSPATIIFQSAIIFSREFLNATVSFQDKK